MFKLFTSVTFNVSLIFSVFETFFSFNFVTTVRVKCLIISCVYSIRIQWDLILFFLYDYFENYLHSHPDHLFYY